MKSVLVIGLGRYGRHVARKLNELGHEVYAIDIDEERVNGALSFVTRAQIGDATNTRFMETIGVRDFDLCVVAIGDNFQSSLETSALLKECGAKFVLARANRDVHAKFLLRNGADDVIYPEKESALRAAVKYSSDSIFDYVRLTDEYSIYETAIPSSWAGKSVSELAVRNKFGLSILAVCRGDDLNPMPGPNYRFLGDERVYVMGENKNVTKYVAMCDRD